MTKQAQRAARKAYTEAAYEKTDRKYLMNTDRSAKKRARRADRRLGKAICRDAL
jgi:hypothetical protein